MLFHRIIHNYLANDKYEIFNIFYEYYVNDWVTNILFI